MPTIVTYNLQQKQQNSDDYYKRIEQLAETISKQLTLHFQKELEDFEEYIRDQQIETLRSREEYGLELLMLGVYNSLYQPAAQQLKKWQETLLTHVVSMRQKTHLQKPFYSKLKGILTTKYLVKDMQNHSNPNYASTSLKQLISYLKASGEFEEAVARLNHWHAFLSLSPSKETQLLKKCTKEAQQFEYLCEIHLKEYLPNVTTHLEKCRQTHKGREDYLWIQSQPVMYYLNMVGAEILNTAFRNSFQQAKEHYIFLPACMTYQNPGQCQRKETAKGYLCQQCTKQCPINQVTQLGKKYGAHTIIVEHGSDLYKTKVQGPSLEKGVIGVACVLNLLEGGWKALQLGYVPQCVILDYCGCKQHWHEEGITTTINCKRLEDLLEN